MALIKWTDMKYTLKQLAVFDAVANQGSVSQAADHLALTQSAASMSLSQLEKVLGNPLFERVGNRMVLTHWGHWLRPKAKHLLSDAHQIESGFVGQHLVSGLIDFGASQTAAEHLVPHLISQIDMDFPEVKVNVEIANSQEVINGVKEHKFQLGVIEGRCDDEELEQWTWMDDHLVIVCGPHHPYAKKGSPSLGQLEQAQWVLREQGAGTRAIFDAAVHGVIDRLNVRHEYAQVSILKALVANNLYLTCLPFLDVQRQIAAGDLVSLAVPELNMSRRLSFIWRRDSLNNPIRDCLLTESKRVRSKL